MYFYKLSAILDLKKKKFCMIYVCFLIETK